MWLLSFAGPGNHNKHGERKTDEMEVMKQKGGETKLAGEEEHTRVKGEVLLHKKGVRRLSVDGRGEKNSRAGCTLLCGGFLGTLGGFGVWWFQSKIQTVRSSKQVRLGTERFDHVWLGKKFNSR